MSKVTEPIVQYLTLKAIEPSNISSLMEWVRNGINFNMFMLLVAKSSFTINEWSKYLHISERTIQRYKKEDKHFDALQSEKILQISMLYQKGVQVFGSREGFDVWLSTKSIALNQEKPKDLLDNAFGISLLQDELIRIEHGVLV